MDIGQGWPFRQPWPVRHNDAMRSRLLLPALLVIALAAGCGDDRGPTADPTAQPSPSTSGMVTVQLDDRPFQLYVPDSYQDGTAMPLLIGLHGYTSRSAELASYLGLVTAAQQRGYLLALPDGTTDVRGDQFWNATDACCDRFGAGVDDAGYLSRLIDTVKQSHTVASVFLIGHSNGGFMSHRMACEHADQITGIASLAGVLWEDAQRCSPSRPVGVLQMHGTADRQVTYEGGRVNGMPAPGAEATIASWREHDGCGDAAPAGEPKDFDSAVSGAETVVTAYDCGATRVQLWRMEGSGHVPAPTPQFTSAIFDFFDSLSA